MDCSTPGSSVLHWGQTPPGVCSDSCPLSWWCYLTSNPLLSPSPLAPNLSQHQGLFQWVGSSHQVAKLLELQLQHQSFRPIFRIDFLSVSSVTQSCLTLCDPMNCSTPGLPVHHQLPESIQSHVHWVGDAIQPSHPLSSPSPLAPNLSQHQGLFKWLSSLNHISFRIDWSDLFTDPLIDPFIGTSQRVGHFSQPLPKSRKICIHLIVVNHI